MSTPSYLPVRPAWLALRREAALEPDLPIVDAHHHFYDRPGWRYLLDDYRADLASGHAVHASVHVQALTRYRADGDEAMRPVGETEFVAGLTEGAVPAVAAGLVGFADLRRGDRVQAVLEAHVEAGRGRCRGALRIGDYARDPQGVFERWCASIREPARRPNVHVKLGGLGMRINGFGFEAEALPPLSATLARAWAPWIETCIEAFGPSRCMFESNAPVDSGSYAWSTGWNAFKRLTAAYAPAERAMLFEGTARRVYRLDPVLAGAAPRPDHPHPRSAP